jgi:peroxidase
MKKRQTLSLSVEQLEARTMFTSSPTTSAASFLAALYSYDGTGNNVQNPTWGSAGTDLLRTAAAAYADGLSAPAGASRPSARTISNTIVDQGDADIISDRMLSAFAYAWGQFVDHDLDLTPTGSEAFNVAVPTGDPSFDPLGTGTQSIPLNRSIYDPATGTTNARQQVNVITSFLDGSMVYGSNAATANALRTFVGGLMKTSAGNLLPWNNAATFPNGTLGMANDAHIYPNDQLFAAGDVRANENIELTALQTVFVREHNFWAAKIAASNPRLTDEQIFQRARAIVIGEIQSITYNEWLPAVLGQRAISSYQGYNASVNPGIANEFSTAAFRVGHSMLGDDVEFLDNNGLPMDEELPLAQAFFNPGEVTSHGVDPILKYLASDPSSEIDSTVVEGVRDFLFGPPGSGGLDLASLNIQRGRDNGLADYNTTRAAYGLPKVTSFAQITSDSAVQAKLKQLYGNVNNIDLWVGALAEDHVRGSSVGPTLRAVISDQFERLRDGDRFFYQNVFSGAQLRQIQNTTLSDILQRTTTLTNLQDNVFFFKASISGTVFVSTQTRFGTSLRGLAGVTVQLINTEDNSVVTTAVTDSRGNYRFDVEDGIRTGKYQVKVVLNDSANLPPNALVKTVAITRGDQDKDVDFVLNTRVRV